MEDMPALSVVLPTVSAWLAIAPTLASLLPQIVEVGGEILVLDGGGRALESDPDPPVRWLRVHTRDAFELRAIGVGAAHAPIVGIGEDHVLFQDDWCSVVLGAFDARPDVDGFVGAAANAKHGVLDRACFLVTLGPWMDPIEQLTSDRTPVPGNVVLRRSVCGGLAGTPGALEYVLLPTLLAEGRLVANPAQKIVHDQSLGTLGAWVVHFSSGRAWGAAPDRPGRRERLRVACSTPRVIVSQTRDVLAQREMHETRTCRCLVAGLACANALGQAIGTLSGAGHAADRLV